MKQPRPFYACRARKPLHTGEAKQPRPFYAFRASKPLHTGVRTECHYQISLSVCVRFTFVVFTDCESCTWPISTTSGSMEASDGGRTRGTCVITCRIKVVAVAGLLWLSWCVFGGAYVFAFSTSLRFQICTPRAVSVDSAKGIRQPPNLST